MNRRRFFLAPLAALAPVTAAPNVFAGVDLAGKADDVTYVLACRDAVGHGHQKYRLGVKFSAPGERVWQRQIICEHCFPRRRPSGTVFIDARGADAESLKRVEAMLKAPPYKVVPR